MYNDTEVLMKQKLWAAVTKLQNSYYHHSSIDAMQMAYVSNLLITSRSNRLGIQLFY